MKIKRQQRVELNPNPLKEVILQINFPRNMEIEKDLPSAFQTFLSKDFPVLEIQEQRSVRFQANAAVANIRPQKEPTIYHFLNKERNRRVTLSSGFLGLSFSTYKNWNEFLKTFSDTFEKLKTIYPIPIVTRIGLRYQNVIDKQGLNLTDSKWSELIKAEVLGPAFNADMYDNETQIEPNVNAYQSFTTLKLSDYQLNMYTGFAENEKKTKVFFIDNDFFNVYNHSTEEFNLSAEIARLHNDAESIFRCLITEKLFNRLSGR